MISYKEEILTYQDLLDQPEEDFVSRHCVNREIVMMKKKSEFDDIACSAIYRNVSKTHPIFKSDLDCLTGNDRFQALLSYSPLAPNIENNCFRKTCFASVFESVGSACPDFMDANALIRSRKMDTFLQEDGTFTAIP